jgi:thioredoxin-like negative regulator of GroEL
MPDELLRQIADEALLRSPSGSILERIAQSLSVPSPDTLYDAATALLSGGPLNTAESVFRALLERLNFGLRAASGLARVAVQRGNPTAAAWRACIERFPDETKPYWHVKLARTERQLGHDAAPESSLRQCVQCLPPFAPAVADLALLLAMTGRPEAAAERWRWAIRNFAEQAKPWWIPEFSAALGAAGQDEEQEVALQEQTLTGSLTLADRALMRAPAEYRRWMGVENL